MAGYHKHRQVAIRHKDLEANVDEGMAELILALWKRGIHTVLSCQENRPGVAWICLPFETDVKRLFLILLQSGWEGFGDRIERPAWRIQDVAKAGRWHTKLDVFEDVDFVGEDEVKGNGTIDLTYSIRFPVSDIKQITRCLQTT